MVKPLDLKAICQIGCKMSLISVSFYFYSVNYLKIRQIQYIIYLNNIIYQGEDDGKTEKNPLVGAVG